MEDLNRLSRERLDLARNDPHGRSAHLFLHQGPLRQTLIAFTRGSGLEDHNAPPAASLQVLEGRVTLTAASGDVRIGPGEIHEIPRERHGLTADEDAVVVLTTVTGIS